MTRSSVISLFKTLLSTTRVSMEGRDFPLNHLYTAWELYPVNVIRSLTS